MVTPILTPLAVQEGRRILAAKPKIITHHEFPPIPIRSFDWCAYRDGREEEGGYGWGPTEEAAIADLLENEEDEA